jgi:hypothetical protein
MSGHYTLQLHYLSDLHLWSESYYFKPRSTNFTVYREIVIIPGNPGVASFYVPFATALFELLNSSPNDATATAIRIIHYAGYYSNPQSPVPALNYASNMNNRANNNFSKKTLFGQIRLYSLNDQIIHLNSVLTQIHIQNSKQISKDTPMHYCLVGHSIGCYLALKIMQIPNRTYNIQHITLLYPFIRYDVDFLHRSLFIGLNWFRHLVTVNLNVIGLLPKSVLSTILFLGSGGLLNTHFAQKAMIDTYLSIAKNTHYQRSTIDRVKELLLMRPTEQSAQSLFLALTEFDQVASKSIRSNNIEDKNSADYINIENKVEPFDQAVLPLLRELYAKNQITMIYSANSDIWAPRAQYNEIKQHIQQIPNVDLENNLILDKRTHHVFCATVSESLHTATIVAQTIRRLDRNNSDPAQISPATLNRASIALNLAAEHPYSVKQSGSDYSTRLSSRV